MMTSDNNNSSFVQLEAFTETEDILTKALYVLLSLIDIIGNSIIILVIATDKKIQNTVNLLIVNISLSDIIASVGIYSYLFTVLSKEDNGTRRNLLCGFKSGSPLLFGASTVNFLTLSALSVSRFLLINFPTNPKWRIRRAHVRWIAMGTWLLGVSLTLPNILSYQYVPETGDCKRFWPSWFKKSLFFSATAIICLMAIVLLFTTYIFSIYKLWFTASTRRLAQSNSQVSSNSTRKKVAILLGLLILAFVACWFPFFTYWMLSATTQYFKKTLEDHVKKLRFMRFTLLVAFFNTCLDPVIYGIGNRQIKDGLRRLFNGGHSSSVEPISTAVE